APRRTIVRGGPSPDEALPAPLTSTRRLRRAALLPLSAGVTLDSIFKVDVGIINAEAGISVCPRRLGWDQSRRAAGTECKPEGRAEFGRVVGLCELFRRRRLHGLVRACAAGSAPISRGCGARSLSRLERRPVRRHLHRACDLSHSAAWRRDVLRAVDRRANVR